MKKNWILRAAAVLLCLTLLSTCWLSGMLAKYSTAAIGADDARVASFGTLTLTETARTYQLIPGVDLTKDPKITMTASEVAVRVEVTLALGEGWVLGADQQTFTYGSTYTEGEQTEPFLRFALAEGWRFDSQSGRTFRFSRELAPGQALEASVLEGNTIAVTDLVPYTDYYDMDPGVLDMDITAKAVQID